MNHEIVHPESVLRFQSAADKIEEAFAKALEFSDPIGSLGIRGVDSASRSSTPVSDWHDQRIAE